MCSSDGTGSTGRGQAAEAAVDQAETSRKWVAMKLAIHPYSVQVPGLQSKWRPTDQDTKLLNKMFFLPFLTVGLHKNKNFKSMDFIWLNTIMTKIF